jgi:hypothetical protein
VFFFLWGCAKSIEYTYKAKGRGDVLIDNLYDNVDIHIEIQGITTYNAGKNYIAKEPYQIKIALNGYALKLTNEIIFNKIVLTANGNEGDIRNNVTMIYYSTEKRTFNEFERKEFSDTGILVMDGSKINDDILLLFGDFNIEYKKTKYIQLYFDITIKNLEQESINIERTYILNRSKIVRRIFPTT